MHIRPDEITRSTLARRREAIAEALGGRPALIAAGEPRPRTFASATYRFRASSHFVYLVGMSLPGAALLLREGRARLFLAPPGPDDALWHGPTATFDDLALWTGCEVAPLEALPAALTGSSPLTLPTPDLRGCRALSGWLGRAVEPGRIKGEDLDLADALIGARLIHDEGAIAGIRDAVSVTERAFRAGMGATRHGDPAWAVRAAMLSKLIERGLEPSFSPIVSVCGEVLHNESSDGVMGSGDLLLVDFGVESRGGWASDVTRTWPVSGCYSPTQRDLYQIVLDAERDAIDAVAPGVRYRDVHTRACRTIAQGLVDLGILRGEVDGLVEDGVHALFFPHGVGHLLGLDVHDMEDLGDLAGYSAGRRRSEIFGLCYLRLDRDLAPGMAVTIEPGFYSVPAILSDPALSDIAGDRLDRDRLADFADVRGIRIEDDVLVTATGREVLTEAIPKPVSEIEAALGDRP